MPIFTPPPSAPHRCYMWNMVKIGFTASEEMSFENVDRQTDGRRRTTDAYLYYKLTNEPSAPIVQAHQ